eukprot:jgi/Mesvir1/1175/Mv17672-RA.1
MEAFATPYPVVFNDGEKEMDCGYVGIHNLLTYKRFQSLVSAKTGLGPASFSSVFVCRRSANDSEKKQKLPINENTNFAIILNQHNPSREKDCHFLVSVRKSKKERKSGRRRTAEADGSVEDDDDSSRTSSSPRSMSGAESQPHIQNGFAAASSPHQPSILTNGRAAAPAAARFGDVKIAQGAGPASGPATQRRDAPQPAAMVPANDRARHPTAAQPVDANGRGPQLASPAALQQPSPQQQQLLQQPQQQLPQAAGAGPSTRLPNGMVGVPVIGSITPNRRQGQALAQPAGPSPAAPNQLQAARGSSTGAVASKPMQYSQVASQDGAGAAPANGATQGGPKPNAAAPRVVAADLGLSGALTGPPLGAQQQQPSSVLAESSTGGGAGRPVGCKYCVYYREQARPAPFHWCPNDRVITGFKGPSPAGPIAPPLKRRLEVAA